MINGTQFTDNYANKRNYFILVNIARISCGKDYSRNLS